MNDDDIRNSIEPELRDELFEIVKLVQSAPYARSNGICVVSVKRNEVRTRMPLDESKMNSIGFAHGAAVFAIADHTFAFAANLQGEAQIVLSSNIVYHRPGTGKELTAVSLRVSDTNTVSTYDIKIYCDGKHIATAAFIGFKMKDRIR
ncbi:MAG: PaaI family thioesterase [Methanomassiliicoccaceae archaeon]|nr:PaaI family thioesterase [Methanomassiliicoccaceae archaeon]